MPSYARGDDRDEPVLIGFVDNPFRVYCETSVI